MPPYASRGELSAEFFAEPFCSYCGRPPRGARREPLRRICSQCKLGMVLHTLPNAAPGANEPFVIVDEQLTVQAISRHAETALMVDEPAGVGAPLDRFLISDNDDPEGLQLAQLVSLVTGGSRLAQAPPLRAVGDPQTRFRARVSGCGPPLAALLVLEPLQDRDPASPNGRDFVERESTRTNGVLRK